MKYYTQQDLCEEFELKQSRVSQLSSRLNIGALHGRVRMYTQFEYDLVDMYIRDIRDEAKLRLRALLIENYRGLKVRDIHKIMRRNGIARTVIETAILDLTDEDDRVWEEWDDDIPDDPDWYDQCENEEELQEKRDERDYMESTLCYGFAWWYADHPEYSTNTNIIEVKFGKEEKDYESVESN